MYLKKDSKLSWIHTDDILDQWELRRLFFRTASLRPHWKPWCDSWTSWYDSRILKWLQTFNSIFLCWCYYYYILLSLFNRGDLWPLLSLLQKTGGSKSGCESCYSCVNHCCLIAPGSKEQHIIL